jgi:hypothetical protein
VLWLFLLLFSFRMLWVVVSIMFLFLEDSMVAVLLSSAKGIEEWTEVDAKVEAVVRSTSFFHDLDEDVEDDADNKSVDRGMRHADKKLVGAVLPTPTL